MPEVYNWQLGRMATYVYDEKHPKEQFTFVFNTNRCIACQTCTMAHKSTWTFSKGQEYMWWNNVETRSIVLR
jgi:nitrate reductase beta subunit